MLSQSRQRKSPVPENKTRKPILLSPPHLTGEEQVFIKGAFDSNWIAPVGPNIDAFEKELCQKVGIDHACALTSGTAAIHLGLTLLGVRPGDLVLCSSLTFVASANPIRYCGAEPVFVDSDPETWCMSLPALERILTKLEAEGRSPKACVTVSLYGQCAPMNQIVELCKNYGVPVLDEAAESLGATCDNQMAGTFGDLGVYSFNGNKIITTAGGGALVSNNENLIDQARFLSTQAREHSDIQAYEHHVIGNNYRMSNVLAGIGRGQLEVLEERIKARQRIFSRYAERTIGAPSIEWMPEAGYGIGTRWLSCCLLPNSRTRNRILGELRENQIDGRPIWKPMHQQPLFAGCRYQRHGSSYDVAGSLFERGLCLPSGSNLDPTDQDRVIDLVLDLLE